MAKHRFAGAGLVVSYSTDGGTNWIPLGLLVDNTLPEEAKAEVDATALEDTFAYLLNGIAQPGRMTCMQRFDPKSTEDLAVDVLYADNTEVAWQIIFDNGNEQSETQFTGRVNRLTPQTVDGQTALNRQITIIPSSVMTHTTPTP